MDENRVSGTARNVGGKIEEGFGRATGDVKSQAEGKLKQAQGAVQDAYGQARDMAADAAETMREQASTFEDALRSTIETRPYTTLLAAFVLGWLLGRTGRYS
jgi:uncharacterized protein YjbJ (UPF0337 family)